jgi:hypothetical protein
MDETGRISRKPSAPKPGKVMAALYKNSGSPGYGKGDPDSRNMAVVYEILEGLAAAYGRQIKIKTIPGGLVCEDPEGECARFSPENAVSMVEEVRTILSPLLDRKV